MSGGHFNYAQSTMRDALVQVAEDAEVQRRWPNTARVFNTLAMILYEREHEMDCDLSSDTRIENDMVFDDAVVGEILEAVMKVAPDGWFPRGKWATIQAVQGRIAERDK